MNVLKIKLEEDGSVCQYTPDFKIMRGSYRNILINLEVPHSLLLEPTKDTDDNTRTTGNNVRIGAVITTVAGKHIQTQRYEFQRVKDFVRQGITYRLYQRRMPKEFTMWETVSQTEATESGQVTLVINVINWVVNDTETKVEEITASPKFTIDIYPSAFLDEAEEIDEPSDFDELQSQVQEIDADIEFLTGVDLTEFKTQVVENTNAISTEVSDRESADTTLQSNIDTETTRATTAETSLQSQISQNASNISSEISNRTNADTDLQNQITSNDKDISSLKSADETLQSNIDAVDDSAVHITGNETISGVKTFEDSMTIKGDLTVAGDISQESSIYETHAEHVYSTNDYIYLRDGATGALTGYSGLEVLNYDGNDTNMRLAVDGNGVARVGDAGDEQPLATREETPENGAFGFWNQTDQKFETDSSIKRVEEGILGAAKIQLNSLVKLYSETDDDGDVNLVIEFEEGE